MLITDGLGRMPITLRLVDSDETKVLSKTSVEVNFDDPRRIYELDLSLNNVVLPDAGLYRLQLVAGNDVLQERTLPVAHFQQAVAR